MLPEVGQLALVIAFCMSLVQAATGLAGSGRFGSQWSDVVRPAAAGQCAFVALAFALLAYAFLTDDFSVLYVAANSNTALPSAYKFAAVWGGHEGSLLLWILFLALWTAAVAAGSHRLRPEFSRRVLGVLGVVSAGVTAFALFTSNPFERLIPAVFDGNDLNPLLQDPAMVLHPPLLYAGYVGLAVPFAFSVAALLEGRLDQDWARATRPWTTLSWVFLTCGITLGSWWAYYELGWGGWWFWDPVENASFMPWLMSAALIHSLAANERRGVFKSWTLLLAIAAFSLSLLGTFLVRSGVLISVHAFASDPARGLFILLLLAVISGGAMLLYAIRARGIDAEEGFAWLSRETFLLANNILLVVAAAVVLLGTVYPLVIDGLGLGKLSVGAPWFNAVFLVPMLPLLVLVGLGMHVGWVKLKGEPLQRRALWPAVFAVVLGITLPLLIFGQASLLSIVGVSAGLWVCLSTLTGFVHRSGTRLEIVLPRRSQLGMLIAHFGLGLFALGASVTSSFGVELDTSARAGDRWTVMGYDFRFLGTQQVSGPNFEAEEAAIEVSRGGELLTVLRPQKRIYRVQQNAMTEAAIDSALHRDIFVALGNSLGSGAWSLRVQVKPMISFLWLGALTMALGGGVAVSDRRYRRTAPSPRAETSEWQPAAEGAQ
jgi:cytochrome c-type biogenesis protein CcmF